MRTNRPDRLPALCACAHQAKKEAKAGGSTADLTKLSLEGGEEEKDVTKYLRTVTGVLTSRVTSRDIKVRAWCLRSSLLAAAPHAARRGRR